MEAKRLRNRPFFAVFHFRAMKLDNSGQYWTNHDNSGQFWTILDIAIAGTVTESHNNCSLLIGQSPPSQPRLRREGHAERGRAQHAAMRGIFRDAGLQAEVCAQSGVGFGAEEVVEGAGVRRRGRGR